MIAVTDKAARRVPVRLQREPGFVIASSVETPSEPLLTTLAADCFAALLLCL